MTERRRHGLKGKGRFDLSVPESNRDTGLPRKEVIQPQLPLRLPCYNLLPVTSHTLGGCVRPRRFAHRLQVQRASMS